MINCCAISSWHFAFSNYISRWPVRRLSASNINKAEQCRTAVWKQHRRIKMDNKLSWCEHCCVSVFFLCFNIDTIFLLLLRCEFMSFVVVSSPMNCSDAAVDFYWCVIKFNDITWRDVYHTRNLIYRCQSFPRGEKTTLKNWFQYFCLFWKIVQHITVDH